MDPISGGLSAILGAIGNLMLGIVNIPIDVAKACLEKPPGTMPQYHTQTLPSLAAGRSIVPTVTNPVKAETLSEEEKLPLIALSNPTNKLEQLVCEAERSQHPALHRENIFQATNDDSLPCSGTTGNYMASSEASGDQRLKSNTKKFPQKITTAKVVFYLTTEANPS